MDMCRAPHRAYDARGMHKSKKTRAAVVAKSGLWLAVAPNNVLPKHLRKQLEQFQKLLKQLRNLMKQHRGQLPKMLQRLLKQLEELMKQFRHLLQLLQS